MWRSDKTVVLRILPLAFAFMAPACGVGQDTALEPTDSEPGALIAHQGSPAPACGQIDEFTIPTVAAGTIFPQDIVPGSDGRLWFSTGQATLGRVSPADGSVSLVPIPVAASRIAAGADGNIWFGTDTGVASISPDRHIVHEFPIPGFGLVTDLAAGPDGAMWVLGFGNIARVTARGQTTLFPIPILVGTSSADHLAAGPDGNLWFTGGGLQAIHRMTRRGVLTDFEVGSPGQVYGLVAGPDGAMWFTQIGAGPNENSIGRITTDGVSSTVVQLPDSTTAPPSAPSNMPLEITAGPGHNLYFTTYLVDPKNYIGRVTLRGVLTKFEVPTPFAASFGITAGPDGNVWFTENFNGLVGRLNLRECHHRG